MPKTDTNFCTHNVYMMAYKQWWANWISVWVDHIKIDHIKIQFNSNDTGIWFDLQTNDSILL